MVAVTENLFYIANTGAESTFLLNGNQQVTHFKLIAEGGEFSFARQN